MPDEARLEETESGLKPVSEGWFVVNVGETGWAVHDAFGSGCTFEGREAQFKQLGINVNVVHPGLTRTEKTAPLVAARAAAAGISTAEMEQRMAAAIVIGRMIEAEEVADIVAFLASPRSAAITGDAIACGGGTKGSIHY